MNDPRELFMHELGDILYAERTLVKVLPKLAQEATDSTLRDAFEKHPGIDGLKKEHDEFVTNEEPSTDVLDMFLTGAAARTEHYEMAAYTGLITMAKALGETDAANLLGENLKQEKAALETVTTISEKLAGKIPAGA